MGQSWGAGDGGEANAAAAAVARADRAVLGGEPHRRVVSGELAAAWEEFDELEVVNSDNDSVDDGSGGEGWRLSRSVGDLSFPPP